MSWGVSTNLVSHTELAKEIQALEIPSNQNPTDEMNYQLFTAKHAALEMIGKDLNRVLPGCTQYRVSLSGHNDATYGGYVQAQISGNK